MSSSANDIVDSYLEVPVIIKVTVKRECITIWHRLRILPKVKHFVVYPPTLGTLMRISKVVESINIFNNEEITKPGGVINLGFKSMSNDMGKIIFILACIISNRKKAPSKSLIKFLTWSFDPKDMQRLLTIFFQKMDVMGFITSIISMKGMSLTPAEIIAPDKAAPGDLKEGLLNTSDLVEKKSDGE